MSMGDAMTEEERVRRARMIESKNKRIRQLRSRIILCAAIVLVLLLGIAVLIGKSKKAEKTVVEDVSVTMKSISQKDRNWMWSYCQSINIQDRERLFPRSTA